MKIIDYLMDAEDRESNDFRICARCGEFIFSGEPYERLTYKLTSGKFYHEDWCDWCYGRMWRKAEYRWGELIRR